MTCITAYIKCIEGDDNGYKNCLYKCMAFLLIGQMSGGLSAVSVVYYTGTLSLSCSFSLSLSLG